MAVPGTATVSFSRLSRGLPVAVLLAMGAAAGCGPSLAAADDEMFDIADSSSGGTTDDGDMRPSVQSAGSGDPQSTGAAETTGAFDSDGGESTGTSDDGLYDPYECGCEPSVLVSVDHQVDDTHSAASVLASIEPQTVTWNWVSIPELAAPTTMTVSLSYDGGEILNGPGGEDGCSFLSSPCLSALLIPVTATVSSGDGALTASVTAVLEVDTERWAEEITLRGEVAFDEIAGTLPDTVIEGLDDEPVALVVSAHWSLDGSLGYVTGAVRTGQSYELIGESDLR